MPTSLITLASVISFPLGLASSLQEKCLHLVSASLSAGSLFACLWLPGSVCLPPAMLTCRHSRSWLYLVLPVSVWTQFLNAVSSDSVYFQRERKVE